MENEIIKYSWVQTHEELVKYLAKHQDNQKELISLLKKVGITMFNDKDVDGSKIDLEEIDPFTFFRYIYKYGPERRLSYLKKLAIELGFQGLPSDESGIPSANAQQVWLFPYKVQRNNNEIARLWNIFHSAISGSITDDQFEDVLKIRSTGKAKLTESLFYINPNEYFPINGPSKPYLKEYLKIDPKFNSYSEYLNILKRIKEKVNKPFYELSYDAWAWNNTRSKVNYWIFQGNPKVYDVISAITNNALDSWTINAHRDEIKIKDKVILWVTGDNPGCYALCEVTSAVYEGIDTEQEMKYYTEPGANEKTSRVKIKITHNLSHNPITKDKINSIEELSDLKVGNQGTNFSATEEEYLTILEMAEPMNEKKYWLFAPGENAEMWDEFYEKKIMALGWDALGNLSNYKSKEELTAKLQELQHTTASKRNDTAAYFNFHSGISIGDIVIVKKGRSRLLGYGEVVSDYYFDDTRSNYQQCRKVDWKKKGDWKTDHTLVLKTLTDITKYKEENSEFNHYYERLLALMDDKEYPVKFPINTIFYGPPGTGKTYNTIIRAAQIVENRIIEDYAEAQRIFNQHLGNRIEFITFHQNYSYEDFIQGLRPDVENVGNLSFERKDGVFKRISDRALKNLQLSEKAPQEVSKEFKFNIALKEFIDEVQEQGDNYKINDTAYILEVEEDAFRYTGNQWLKHANGLRMKFKDLRQFYLNDITSRKDIKNLTSVSGLSIQHATYYYIVYEKILKYLPKQLKSPDNVKKQNYVIIIDEINRANISRVFGELITLIEPDKRSNGSIPLKCTLPSGEEFVVPSNLYIIGTMNTADKSIALLDIALRRRFSFEAMYPLYDIEGSDIYDVDILKKINKQIRELKGIDFQIGHSYFMGDNIDPVERMNRKVIPLLLEYFMNDEKEVKGILQNAGLSVEEDSWPLEINGIL